MWSAAASIDSSVTAAPPIDLPRADSWPSRVRSRMYSRSIPDSAASTVNTTPDGSWEPCSPPVRNSSPIPSARTGDRSSRTASHAKPDPGCVHSRDCSGSPYHPAKNQRLGSRPGNGPVRCRLVMVGGGGRWRRRGGRRPRVRGGRGARVTGRRRALGRASSIGVLVPSSELVRRLCRSWWRVQPRTSSSSS